MQKKKHSGEEFYGELGQAFNFTQGDLEANRAGFMSWRQKILNRRHLYHGFLFFGFVLLIFGLIDAFFWFLVYNTTSSTFELRAGITSILSILLIFGLAVLFIRLWIYRHDLLNGSVTKYEGKVELNYHLVSRSFRYRYFLSFEGNTIQISKEEYLAVDTGKNYKLYYLPKTKVIVSIEEALVE